MTKIRHPESPGELAERDRLLEKALRPKSSPFAFAQVYPTVLSRQDVRFSWGLYKDTRLIAHANLWPRILRDHKKGLSINVGLIGNVATDQEFRGHGHMSFLLESLTEKASDQGLSALILWSDQTEFYQKRGFASCGMEKRYVFRTSRLRSQDNLRHLSKRFQSRPPRRVSSIPLLSSRFPVQTTLERSPHLCSQLLCTVGLNLWVDEDTPDRFHAFVAMGKGFDLVHVVHEWGAPTPESLLAGILKAGSHQGYEEVMLLAPTTLTSDWDKVLTQIADHVETCPMALARTLDPNHEIQEALAHAFIWGLDSI